MAAKPALHIFPPVEEVHKRRESLDELIRRSMDMRPTGPWQSRNDNHVVQPKYTNPKLKTTGGRSPTNAEAAVIKVDVADSSPTAAQSQNMRSTARSQKLNPYPLQVPGATVAPRRSASASPSRTRPQRRPSVSGQRGRSPAPATIPEGVVTKDTFESPVSLDEFPTATQRSIRRRDEIPRNFPSRTSSRNTAIQTMSPDGSESATPISLSERSVSSRASNWNKASPISPPKRQGSSRASNRKHVVVPNSPHQSRVVSPAPSEQTLATISGSPIALARANSAATWKNSPISPEVSMRSMFPTYDHRVPLSRQPYRPSQAIPAAIVVSPEKVSKPAYSPTLENEMLQMPLPDITPANELKSLWNCANGQVLAPNPKTFTMNMYRPDAGAKKQKITFGPDESQPFYSLSQSHPTSVEEDPLHELLVFRHSPLSEDILPICHHMLNPPPPPMLSKANRGSLVSNTHEPAICITNITPIIATLHSLDCAAKTKEAHTLALVDPRATSPAAAKLAERAVADAIARESCTLAWTRTCPRTGKYELHHPSLGVFTIIVEGDVKAAFEHPNSARGPTSISITNPFASLTPKSTSSPSSSRSSNSESISLSSTIPFHRKSDSTSSRDQAILARLDLYQDILHVDAEQIQQLGNIYLLDTCVSALFSVAVAEAQRPEDPGLIFAAPPPSAHILGSGSKAKKKAAKLAAAADAKAAKKTAAAAASASGGTRKRRTLTNGESMDLSLAGIQHLADEEDLPRLTRGILSVLGLSFKTLVWLLGVGVKLTAHMVVGMSKVVAKDGL